MKTSKRIFCVLLSAGMLFLCSCGGKNTDETTTDETIAGDVTEQTTEALQTETEQTSTADDVTTYVTGQPATEVPQTESVTEKVTEKETEKATERVTAAAETTPAKTSYSAAEITEILKNAVNKTKSYTGSITVHHKESFSDLKISNVQPGGELSSRALNFITGLIVKPSEEDYSFSGGKATTSEGETTQLLLPKDAPFSLTADGVKSAKLETENGMTHITLTLKSEQCESLTDKPSYNASAIGYLDLSGAFSKMKITSITVKYPGSVIDAYIRSDGYVSSVTYTVNMECHGEASYGVINGSADFKGAQTEIWTLKW